MNKTTRIRVASLALLLSLAYLGHVALCAHLQSIPALVNAPLRRPLSDLPLQLSDWQGQDLEIDEDWAYADQALYRAYQDRRGHRVTAWIAYSTCGDDRRHHPQVCLGALGQVEDHTARKQLSAPGDATGIAQAKFGQHGKSQWNFYWYYTLSRSARERVSVLQQLHLEFSQRQPSVSLQVFAAARSSESEQAARELVLLLDAAVRRQIEPQARRGNRRLPVVVVD